MILFWTFKNYFTFQLFENRKKTITIFRSKEKQQKSIFFYDSVKFEIFKKKLLTFFCGFQSKLEHNPYPLPSAIFGYYYSAVYSCQLPVFFCAKQSICTTFTKRRIARRKIITPRGWFSREQASNGAKENCLAASAKQLSGRVSIVV